MSEFVVYILHSDTYNKIYIAYNSNLIQRFYSHNSLATKGHTKSYSPWKVIYVQFFESKKVALAREKFLKSGVGRKWIYSNLF